MTIEQQVAAHYGRDDRISAILAALTAAGKDVDHLTLDDLAPIDEFHVRGREATRELGERLNLAPDMHVLDVGSGVGGPSRYVAATYGCRVTGIDLTEQYCRAATVLAERVGLSAKLDYRQGSALAMPFGDRAFDAAYTQHVAMNISDKAALYAEVARVLRPGATFGIYDILQGQGGELIVPVPWARDASVSFLATPDEMRALLEGAGFQVESVRDQTTQGRQFFESMFARIAESGPPPLGLHLLLPDFRQLAQNVLKNLAEERIRVAQIICSKTAETGKGA